MQVGLLFPVFPLNLTKQHQRASCYHENRLLFYRHLLLSSNGGRHIFSSAPTRFTRLPQITPQFVRPMTVTTPSLVRNINSDLFSDQQDLPLTSAHVHANKLLLYFFLKPRSPPPNGSVSLVLARSSRILCF